MCLFDQTSATLHVEIQLCCTSLSLKLRRALGWVRAALGCRKPLGVVAVDTFQSCPGCSFGAVHYRHRDWVQSCACTSSAFSDRSSASKTFFTVKVTNTYESLKIAILEISLSLQIVCLENVAAEQ